MRIAVYTIVKNEAARIRDWLDCAEQADALVLLDTGSTDGTMEAVEAWQAEHPAADVRLAQETITPWRFDSARNRAMDMIPEDVDVCVSLDADEVMAEGWRAALERSWTAESQLGEYWYIWSHDADGRDGVAFWQQKIHARRGWRWAGPVHEVLRAEFGQHRAQVTVTRIEGLRIDHWPDESKSRGQYLPLLEQAVAEDPHNDRNRHYLGREYYYYGRYAEAINTLGQHLQMPEAIWEPERAESYMIMGRCWEALGMAEGAETCYRVACATDRGRREPWLALAGLHYRAKNWTELERACAGALRVRTRTGVYMETAEAWGARPYDLMALALWHQGRAEEAAWYAAEAARLEPGDKRLRENWEYMRRTKDD